MHLPELHMTMFMPLATPVQGLRMRVPKTKRGIEFVTPGRTMAFLGCYHVYGLLSIYDCHVMLLYLNELLHRL